MIIMIISKLLSIIFFTFSLFSEFNKIWYINLDILIYDNFFFNQNSNYISIIIIKLIPKLKFFFSFFSFDKEPLVMNGWHLLFSPIGL